MAKEEFDKLPMKINCYFNAKTVSWAELAPETEETEERDLPRAVL